MSELSSLDASFQDRIYFSLDFISFIKSSKEKSYDCPKKEEIDGKKVILLFIHKVQILRGRTICCYSCM